MTIENAGEVEQGARHGRDPDAVLERDLVAGEAHR